MSTGTIEAIELDLAELFSQGTPPCELVLRTWSSGYEVACGKPSAYRIRSACGCGAVRIRFLCAKHYRALRMSRVVCDTCEDTEFDTRVF